MGLEADDQLITETVPEGLLLRPAVTLPVEIYTERRIAVFDAPEAARTLGPLPVQGFLNANILLSVARFKARSLNHGAA